jgi:GntR family transcriptional regulator, transcriptional repressor for pyruvate dehydrogenase complex
MDLAPQKALPRVAKVSLVDEVIAAMRTMLSETWTVGSKLPSELELSRQLGVGRSTVREALRVLEHLGLVESRSGLGTFVIEKRMPPARTEYPQGPEALVQLYEFRRTIEVPSARLAAERRTSEQLANIKSAWRNCELAVKRDSADEFAQLDFLFHAAIVKATQNRFLFETYLGVQDSFASNVTLILGQGQLKSMLHFHDDLIEAIEQREPKLAARAAEDNFKEIDVRVRLLLQNVNGTDKSRKR